MSFIPTAKERPGYGWALSYGVSGATIPTRLQHRQCLILFLSDNKRRSYASTRAAERQSSKHRNHKKNLQRPVRVASPRRKRAQRSVILTATPSAQNTALLCASHALDVPTVEDGKKIRPRTQHVQSLVPYKDIRGHIWRCKSFLSIFVEHSHDANQASVRIKTCYANHLHTTDFSCWYLTVTGLGLSKLSP